MMKNNNLKYFLVVIALFLGLTKINAQGKVFTESNETIVIEAEHYFELIEGSAKTIEGTAYDYSGGFWSVSTDYSGYTGEGYMVAPDFATKIDNEDVVTQVSPGIKYRINFTNPGTYYWFARSSYSNDQSDSYHLGMGDSLVIGTMMPYREIGTNWDTWGWGNTNNSNIEATFNIPTAGVHDIVVYMREPNHRLDKIVLTTSPGDAPSGLNEPGPDETTYTGIKVSAVDNSFNVYPNPATNQAIITFDVVKAGDLDVSVYNTAGQKVKVLLNETSSTGFRQVTWNISGDNKVEPGLYFVKIDNAGELAVRKVVVQ